MIMTFIFTNHGKLCAYPEQEDKQRFLPRIPTVMENPRKVMKFSKFTEIFWKSHEMGWGGVLVFLCRPVFCPLNRRSFFFFHLFIVHVCVISNPLDSYTPAFSLNEKKEKAIYCKSSTQKSTRIQFVYQFSSLWRRYTAM